MNKLSPSIHLLACLGLVLIVAAGGPDGAGNLALETAGGEQRMLFNNSGAAAK